VNILKIWAPLPPHKKRDNQGMEDHLPARRTTFTIWQFPSSPRLFSQLYYFKKVVVVPHRVVSYRVISLSKNDDPPNPADRLSHTFIYEMDC